MIVTNYFLSLNKLLFNDFFVMIIFYLKIVNTMTNNYFWSLNKLLFNDFLVVKGSAKTIMVIHYAMTIFFFFKAATMNNIHNILNEGQIF